MKPDLIAYTWQTPLGVQLVYQPTGGAQLQPARRKRPATKVDRVVAWKWLLEHALAELIEGSRAMTIGSEVLGVEARVALLLEASRVATELSRGLEPDGDD